MSHIDCADDQRSYLDTVASRVLTHSLTHQNPSLLIDCSMHAGLIGIWPILIIAKAEF